ncbi:MAG: gliding motility-associated C-terminal domain-containing protein [Bacteroidales bacterium]|nr:gliding motility-associated C-terminal domain-containing protein [Bacteroidales bacterium]
MQKVLFIFLFGFLSHHLLFATHERAGEITYKHISGLTYEITLITYTYSPSPADRPELEIMWGDGTSTVLPRAGYIDLTAVIRRNIYIGQHTYAGNGIFKISLEDPNRNYGIVNIPNSVNIPFYIESELVINPFLGSNNSVVLLNPPLDYGCVDRLYIHNPGAYDEDGDSLSYKLTVCKGSGGLPIPGYTLPEASNVFTIDVFNGDLIWDKPVLQGEYNVAFIIEEWRLGQRIGYVTRDLQIQIGACDNYPPEIVTIDDTCVEAGDYLKFEVTAEDPDGDKVYLSATGSPFLQIQSPAVLDPEVAIGYGSATALFEWETNCSHIKKNPHPVFFKARDSVNTISLTSYKTVNITVVGPAPQFPQAVPLGNSITLSWLKTECENAVGYRIYRNVGYYGFVPDHCETGVPAYTGYQLIAETDNIQDTVFIDNNNGNGLIHGIQYCYMITAIFPDGAESYASVETCATLRKDLPIITNVDVLSTDLSNGSIKVVWSKPTELDYSQTPGPFEYQLFRRSNEPQSNFSLIAIFSSLDDTVFTDNQLNTLDFQYRYRIDFYNRETGNEFLIGSTVVAPSIFLTINETDKSLLLNWNNDVPWINDTFAIFRFEPELQDFDSIGYSIIPEYMDTGLVNGQQYCYKIKTIGRYSSPGLIDPIINFSQENCGVPVDNIPPCAPFLSLQTNCEVLNNELSWIYPDSCTMEELTYNVFYAESTSSDYNLIGTTADTYYLFETSPPSVVGCFTVTALDSLVNQSVYSNVVCVDINECGRIWFPYVFTPNGDNKNDFFRADSVNSIQKLTLKIFNRWGGIVYETSDPQFKWDGRDQKNNRDCSPGVYFFEGIVSEYTLGGPVERQVKGSITLLR